MALDGDSGCDSGWAWKDAEHTHVTFCGSYCNQLMSGGVGEMRTTYGCPTIC